MYLEGGSLCSEGGWTGPASESHVRENGGSRGVRGGKEGSDEAHSHKLAHHTPPGRAVPSISFCQR